MIVTPTLHFHGRCEEAIRLYEQVPGLSMRVLLRYADADRRDWDVPLSGAERRLVYHAEGYLGQQRVMLCDDTERAYGGDEPAIFLTVTFDTAGEVRRAFSLPEEGGQVVYPLRATTYNSCMGSLIDRSGFRWGLMTEQTER